MFVLQEHDAVVDGELDRIVNPRFEVTQQESGKLFLRPVSGQHGQVHVLRESRLTPALNRDAADEAELPAVPEAPVPVQRDLSLCFVPCEPSLLFHKPGSWFRREVLHSLLKEAVAAVDHLRRIRRADVGIANLLQQGSRSDPGLNSDGTLVVTEPGEPLGQLSLPGPT